MVINTKTLKNLYINLFYILYLYHESFLWADFGKNFGIIYYQAPCSYRLAYIRVIKYFDNIQLMPGVA